MPRMNIPLVKVRWLLIAVIAMSYVCGVGRAQLSRLYVSNNLNNGGWAIDVFRNQLFDFAFNTATPLSSTSEAAIAVWGDVRTASIDPTLGAGHLYDLNGNYLNQSYAPNGPPRPDGTSDGQYNYALVGGTVTQFDRQWQNPTSLFTSPTSRTFGYGITYDQVDQSLWIHSYEEDPITGARTYWVEQFSKAGQRLGGAPVTSSSPFYFGEQGGLALDPADRTLWIVNQTEFIQVGRNGVALIDPINPNPFIYVNPPGAEFNLLVPEPASTMLAPVAFIFFRRRRR